MSGEYLVCPGDEVLAKAYIWGCEEADAMQAVRLMSLCDVWYRVEQVREMKGRAWLMIRNRCNRCWWIELSDVVKARRGFVPSGVADGQSS